MAEERDDKKWGRTWEKEETIILLEKWGVGGGERIFVLRETSGLSLLLGKPAQREGARTGLEVLCEVLHPTLSRPERPDHNTGNFMPYSLRQVCGFFYVPQDYKH